VNWALSVTLVGIVFGLGALGVLLGALVSAGLSRRSASGRRRRLDVCRPDRPRSSSAYAVERARGRRPALLLGVPDRPDRSCLQRNQVSFRQAITPSQHAGPHERDHALRGLGHAADRLAPRGVLASFLPVRTTILVGAAVASAAFLWVLRVAVRSLRVIPSDGTSPAE